jgi:hypothetical protein
VLDIGTIPANVFVPQPAMNVRSLQPAPSGKTDAADVLAALRSYSSAWQSRNVNRIIALRPGLNKRTVRAELKDVVSLRMNIRPIAEPDIEDDVARVSCIHQVTQTFSGGVQKHSSEVRMTYLLVKRNGKWVIDRTK